MHIEWNYFTSQKIVNESHILSIIINVIVFKTKKMYLMLILKFHEKKTFNDNNVVSGKNIYVEAVQLCNITIIIWILTGEKVNVN